MNNHRHRNIVLALVLGVIFAFPGHAVVPGQTSHQGLLLDDLGIPINGQVDFVFTIFDAIAGGTQLWTEAHTDVDVVDGVYDVVLGQTTPITQTVLSGGSVFLEIEVDGETLSPRQQLLAVPYALEAEHAASADTASDSAALGGLDSGALTEIYQHFSFDGGDPPNDDPSEGLADSDGDGLANFVDADNDDDGLSDVVEVGQGSDINLPTPFVATALPTSGTSAITTTVSITGGNFDPGQTVTLGSGTPMSLNLTSGSFDIDVGPQTVGAKDLTVTLPNGESTTVDDAFTFLGPTVTGIAPPNGSSVSSQTVTINGTNFAPGATVVFGSETPTPTNLTPTSMDVLVGPQPSSLADVRVTNVDGETFLLADAFAFGVAITSIDPDFGSDVSNSFLTISGFNFDGAITVTFGGVSAATLNVTPTSFNAVVAPQIAGKVDVTITNPSTETFTLVDGFQFLSSDAATRPSLAISGTSFLAMTRSQSYQVDTDYDFAIDEEHALASEGDIAVAVDPFGRLAGLHCRPNPGNADECFVEFLLDANDDQILEQSEAIAIETVSGTTPEIRGTALAFDSSGGAVAAYSSQIGGNMSTAVVAHDRNNDGDFDDTNERVQIASWAYFAAHIGDVALDSSNRPAYLFRRASDNALLLAYDRSGDGDFDDTVGGVPELTTVASAILECAGVTFDASDHLAVVYGPGTGKTNLLRDLNGDGDFLDGGGEFGFLTNTQAEGACDIIGGPGLGLAATQDAGGDLYLVVDRNNDGDFLDTDENVLLDPNSPGPAEIRRDGTGKAVVVTPYEIFPDPI